MQKKSLFVYNNNNKRICSYVLQFSHSNNVLIGNLTVWSLPTRLKIEGTLFSVIYK